MKARNENTNDYDQLLNILKVKLEFESGYNPNQLGQKGKNSIITAILETTKQLPVSLAQIKRVIIDPRIKLICTTSERIKAAAGASASAYFSPDTVAIYFSPLSLTTSLINHEFRHADSFLRHMQNEKNLLQATFPIVFNQENIQHYTQALNSGDKRIKHFMTLWERNKRKEFLSPDDIQLLNNYMRAAQQCLVPLIYDINDKKILPLLIQQGVQPGSIMTKGLEQMKILSLETQGNKLIIAMEPVDPAMRIFQVLKDVNEKLNNETYRNKSTIEKLIERDAYTFQRLSEDAINLFYPEAQNLINEDIKIYNQKIEKANISSPEISKHNIFNKIDSAYDQLVFFVKTNCPNLSQAIQSKEFSLAVRQGSSNGQYKAIEQILNYVKSNLEVDAKFNINAKSSNGNTALDWAQQKIKDPDILKNTVDLLIKYGAKSKSTLENSI